MVAIPKKVSLWRRDCERVFSCPVEVVRISRAAFTLVELLVVVAVIGILLAVLLPALGISRERARSTKCLSNSRQLHIANTMYAHEWNDHYIPAAPDIFASNSIRWHGIRESGDQIFDPRGSALYAYFGQQDVKLCPSFRRFLDEGSGAFEAGTGGYGYNQQYVGGTNYLFGFDTRSAKHSTRTAGIEIPEECIMFGDAALPYPNGTIIEYSFIEPPFWHLNAGKEPSSFKPDPSMHFRHKGYANAVWCDGHASSEKFAFTTDVNAYHGDNLKCQVGWFDPDNNSKFDIWK
jgi:prepilin-type N-terminal cleavage/methylation domain-containing protein/prepilin-type processing-associated H-X9-DG protein